MTLARLRLASGREIALVQFHAVGTYDGMLEGLPTRRVNDRMLARLAAQAEAVFGGGWPIHIVEPARTATDRVANRRGETVELLPSVTCFGTFESEPKNSDDANPFSGDPFGLSILQVVWFQRDLDQPIGVTASAAVRELDWCSLAVDCQT